MWIRSQPPPLPAPLNRFTKPRLFPQQKEAEKGVLRTLKWLLTGAMWPLPYKCSRIIKVVNLNTVRTLGHHRQRKRDIHFPKNTQLYTQSLQIPWKLFLSWVKHSVKWLLSVQKFTTVRERQDWVYTIFIHRAIFRVRKSKYNLHAITMQREM